MVSVTPGLVNILDYNVTSENLFVRLIRTFWNLLAGPAERQLQHMPRQKIISVTSQRRFDKTTWQLRTQQHNKNDKDDAFVNKIIHHNKSELETLNGYYFANRKSIRWIGSTISACIAKLGILEH